QASPCSRGHTWWGLRAEAPPVTSPERRTLSRPQNVIDGYSMTRACSRPAAPPSTRRLCWPRPSKTSPAKFRL
ncbi:unnamed protein product, partial [Musa textilis]